MERPSEATRTERAQLRERLGRDHLGTLTYNRLCIAGYDSLDKVKAMKDQDVLDCDGLGRATLRRICERVFERPVNDDKYWTIALIEEALGDAQLVHDFQKELRAAPLASGDLAKVFRRWQETANEKLSADGADAKQQDEYVATEG